jgi:hypothetical protein
VPHEKLCYLAESKKVPRPMKTNVTLKIDAGLLREAKVLAAKRNSSVSRLLAETLEKLVRGEKSYEAARSRALARLAKGYDLGWTRPANRKELHER